MASIKLTKSAVDAAKPQAQAVELRDTVLPGSLRKITPAGRKACVYRLIVALGKSVRGHVLSSRLIEPAQGCCRSRLGSLKTRPP